MPSSREEAMNQQKKFVESANRGFGSLGDEQAPPGQRHVIEDRLIDILDHCITHAGPGLLRVQVAPFREFLRAYGRQAGYGQSDIDLCMRDDKFAEMMTLWTAASLKRCAHLYEWCVNVLLQEGLPIDALPDGQGYLRC
jgi:hypothetical protein